MSARCPQCDGDALHRSENPAFPFCSQRCKEVDLGRWFNQEYVISSPALDPDGFPIVPMSSDDDDGGGRF